MTALTPRSSQESEDSTSASNEQDGAPSASQRSTPTPAPSSQSDGPESRTSVTSRLYEPASALDENWTERTTVNALRAEGSRSSQPMLHSGPEASPARTSASPASDEASDSTMMAFDYLNSGTAESHDGVVGSLPTRQGWTVATGLAAQSSNPPPVPASPSPSLTLWSATDLPPSSSKTYRDSSPVMAARILGRSSVVWANSGTGGPTGFSTLSSSECPSDDDGCSFVPSTLAQVLEPTAPQRFYLSARAAAGILRRATRRGRELPTALHQALTLLSTQLPVETTATTKMEPHRDSRSGAASESDGHPQSSVRRLTPVECERLMGWPDGWTIASSHRRSGSGQRNRKTADPAIPSRSSPPPSTAAETTEGSEPSLANTSSFAEMIGLMSIERLEDWEALEPGAFSRWASTPTDTDAAETES